MYSTKVFFEETRFRLDSTSDDSGRVIGGMTSFEFNSPHLYIQGVYAGDRPEKYPTGRVEAVVHMTTKAFVQAVQFAIDCPPDPNKTPPLWPVQKRNIEEKLLQILDGKEVSSVRRPLILSNRGHMVENWTMVDLQHDALGKAEAYVKKQASRLFALAL